MTLPLKPKIPPQLRRFDMPCIALLVTGARVPFTVSLVPGR